MVDDLFNTEDKQMKRLKRNQWLLNVLVLLAIVAFWPGMGWLTSNVEIPGPVVRLAHATVLTTQEMWNGVYNAAYGTRTAAGSLNVTMSSDARPTASTMVTAQSSTAISGAASVTNICATALVNNFSPQLFDSLTTSTGSAMRSNPSVHYIYDSACQHYDPPLTFSTGIWARLYTASSGRVVITYLE